MGPGQKAPISTLAHLLKRGPNYCSCVRRALSHASCYDPQTSHARPLPGKKCILSIDGELKRRQSVAACCMIDCVCARAVFCVRRRSLYYTALPPRLSRFVSPRAQKKLVCEMGANLLGETRFTSFSCRRTLVFQNAQQP